MVEAMNRQRRRMLRTAALVGAAGFPTLARALFPSRPVELIVPGGAGGATDTIARAIQVPWGEVLGQAVIVDNRAGAGGIVGTLDAIRSAPDGYTTLLASLGTHVLVPLLMPKVGFDTLHDLAPVTRLANVRRSSGDARLLRAPHRIDRARARFARAACMARQVDGTGHVIAELLCQRTGTALHIPYKSSSQSYTDLIAGRVPLLFTLVTGVQPQVASGKLKGIAVTTARRVSALPNVPTIQESGIRDFDIAGWLGLMVPAGTPTPVVNHLQRALGEALRVGEVRTRFNDIGAEVIGDTPGQFAAQLHVDFKRWREVIRTANIVVN
jgi:tripartite-type tricarboxylate transporter receptor subunit TctC